MGIIELCWAIAFVAIAFGVAFKGGYNYAIYGLDEEGHMLLATWLTLFVPLIAKDAIFTRAWDMLSVALSAVQGGGVATFTSAVLMLGMVFAYSSLVVIAGVSLGHRFGLAQQCEGCGLSLGG